MIDDFRLTIFLLDTGGLMKYHVGCKTSALLTFNSFLQIREENENNTMFQKKPNAAFWFLVGLGTCLYLL